MTIEKYRSREIRREIRRVLLQEWDPIAVKDVPEAQDECDIYVGGVFALLVRKASEDEIIERLYSIEKDRMGLACSDKQALRTVARALLAIDVSG